MPTPLNKLDIYNSNFDHYVLLHVEKITPEQKSLLPAKIVGKLFKKEEATVEYLTVQEKMYILSVCFSKRVTIVVEDEKDGIGIKEYKAALKAQKGNITNGEALEVMKTSASFILGDKELMKALLYMNHMYCSDIYTLVKMVNPRSKGKKEIKQDNIHKSFSKLIQMFTNYEGRKKSVLQQYDINVPKFYALLYYFDGEKKGVDFYTTAFRYAYTSNRSDLGAAQKELYVSGHLDRRGATKQLRYIITGKGIELLRNILIKLIYP